tara:strand:- start:1341 stop:1607 length:267 start_codon:yes stop_codon:yes gene_type:complete
MLINAHNFHQAIKIEQMVKAQVKTEMPASSFLLTSIDNAAIYFNVVAPKIKITSQQVKDLKQKTGFLILKENTSGALYNAHFKMFLYP